MNLQPRIETLKAKKLMGMHLNMSLAGNRTGELWRSFMPRRKEITNGLSSDMFSLQVLDPAYFDNFNPHKTFEKWALIEVADFDAIPEGMEPFELTGGLYAVFSFIGLSTDTKIFEYIFAHWLPASDYVLDHRPHFEILGEKYKNNDPNSEEEIWIPVQLKL